MKVLKTVKVDIDSLKDLYGTPEYDLALQQIRQPMFEALNTVFIHHLLGIKPLSSTELTDVLVWRQNMCDKIESAYYNIPDSVYYHYSRTYLRNRKA